LKNQVFQSGGAEMKRIYLPILVFLALSLLFYPTLGEARGGHGGGGHGGHGGGHASFSGGHGGGGHGGYYGGGYRSGAVGSYYGGGYRGGYYGGGYGPRYGGWYGGGYPYRYAGWYGGYPYYPYYPYYGRCSRTVPGHWETRWDPNLQRYLQVYVPPYTYSYRCP
jgi:hypothetical protein